MITPEKNQPNSISEIVKNPHSGNGKPIDLTEEQITAIIESVVLKALEQHERARKEPTQTPIPRIPPFVPSEDLATQLLRYQMHTTQEELKKIEDEVKNVAGKVSENNLRLERMAIVQKVELAVLGVLGTSAVGATVKFIFDQIK